MPLSVGNSFGFGLEQTFVNYAKQFSARKIGKKMRIFLHGIRANSVSLNDRSRPGVAIAVLPYQLAHRHIVDQPHPGQPGRRE